MEGSEITCRWRGQRLHVGGRVRDYMWVEGSEITRGWKGQRLHVGKQDGLHLFLRF